MLGNSRSSTKCERCPRDRQGKSKPDPNAASAFKRTHAKPPGCNKCEVDHIVPLSNGGQDEPNDMPSRPREQHQDKTTRDLRHSGSEDREERATGG